MSALERPALALTMGEPAGIGGEVALKAWLRRPEAPPFFVIDDPDRLRALAASLDLPVPVSVVDAPETARAVFAEALPVLPHPLEAPVVPGRPDAANAPAVIAAIERAVRLVEQGRAAALVTNPISKQALYGTGFPHRGHTEFLGALAGVRPVMMLQCPGLRVVPVTVHVPLAEAAASLDSETIVHCVRVTADALRRDFGLDQPAIAVAGLNPHAGEGGTLGTEEETVIAPAVTWLKRAGYIVTGPLPADTLFHDRARAAYDAVVCMYHDQALIPVKTIDFDHGVNISLGLPFVRTSPDHGTAFEIAGTGAAREDSLVAALATAAAMAARRARAT